MPSLLKTVSKLKRSKMTHKIIQLNLPKLKNQLKRFLRPMMFLKNKTLKNQSLRNQFKKQLRSKRKRLLRKPRKQLKKSTNQVTSQKVKTLLKKLLKSLRIKSSQQWLPNLHSPPRSNKKRQTKKKETNICFLRDFSNSSRPMKSSIQFSQVISANLSPF